MRIAQEEIFGPVVCVIAYHDEDEAVALANDSVSLRNDPEVQKAYLGT